MNDPCVHPRTGEVVGTTLTELIEAERVIDLELRGNAPLYRFRDDLRGRIAEARGPAVLPPRGRRTDVQRRVAACPRCGMVPELKVAA
jgi:hypothetical protein